MIRRIVVSMVLTIGVASAQWLHYPTPGIPRTPAGKPNITASVPKTADGKPDLSGLWVRIRPAGAPGGPEFGNTVTYYMAPGAKVPFQPWAEELFNKRRYEDLGAGRPPPSGACRTELIGAMLPNTPFKMVQTPALMVILYEEFNHYRQIFTDGRPHTPEPNPVWYGYSIGEWEGDIFVVDSTGFNDKTWLDDSGHPHTDGNALLRAVPPHRLRPHGSGGHHRRSQSVHQALVGHDSPGVNAGHGNDRGRLRQRKGRGPRSR